MATKGFKFNIAGIDNELVKRTALTYIGVIFLVVVAVLFVMPRLTDLTLLRRNVDKELKRLKSVEASLTMLDQFEVRVGKNNVERIETALPVSFDAGLVLSELRKLSNDNEVVITAYSLKGGEIKSEGEEPVEEKVVAGRLGIKNVEFDLTVSGPAARLIKFMEGVENSLPLANIAEVGAAEVAKVVKSGESRNEINLSLKLNYYYLPYQGLGGDETTTLDDYLITSEDMLLLTRLATFRQPTKATAGQISGGGNEDLFGEN